MTGSRDVGAPSRERCCNGPHTSTRGISGAQRPDQGEHFRSRINRVAFTNTAQQDREGERGGRTYGARISSNRGPLARPTRRKPPNNPHPSPRMQSELPPGAPGRPWHVPSTSYTLYLTRGPRRAPLPWRRGEGEGGGSVRRSTYVQAPTRYAALDLGARGQRWGGSAWRGGGGRHYKASFNGKYLHD